MLILGAAGDQFNLEEVQDLRRQALASKAQLVSAGWIPSSMMEYLEQADQQEIATSEKLIQETIKRRSSSNGEKMQPAIKVRILSEVGGHAGAGVVLCSCSWSHPHPFPLVFFFVCLFYNNNNRVYMYRSQ